MPGTFQQMPGGLQEQPFLRVGQRRLTRGIAEETGIEFVDIGQEPAPLAMRGAGPALLRRVERGMVPALRRHLGHQIAAVAQRLPEFLRRIGAGIAPGHRDNGDVPGGRLRLGGRLWGGCGFRLTQRRAKGVTMAFRQRPGQRGELRIFQQQRGRQRAQLALHRLDDLQGAN